MSSAGGVFAPGRLWGALDMLTFLFGTFYHQLRTLRALVETLNITKDRPEALGDKFYAETINDLQALANGCAELELTQSVNRINRIISFIRNKRDHSYLRIHLADLEPGIREEGARFLIMTIPADRGDLLFGITSDPFWGDIIDKFPSTNADCASAMVCYACDEGTASAFHSMRILELGLKLLSEALNVPFGTDVWHVVIDQIESEIKELERRWPRGNTKSEFLRFYSQAAKEFRYFKDGWRNYVSHRLSIYDAPQALSIMTHVRDFMLSLSSRLSETE
jgi:hypothetical protein